MKKTVAWILVVMLVLGLCACSQQATAPQPEAPKAEAPQAEAPQTEAPQAEAPKTDKEKLTIGYTFWDLPLAGIVIDGANMIKLAAEALDVNLVFNPSMDLSAEGVMAAAENFVTSGVDGLIVVNMSEASMINIGKVCQENGVPFVQAYRTLNDPDISAQLEANPYYVGRVHEDEYASAYELGKKLAATGAKKVVMFSSNHGDTTYETRAQAYRDACKDFGMELLLEQWDIPDDTTATETIVNVLNAYPEIDGILTVKCNFVPFIVTAEETVGITDWLPIVGVDFDTTLGENIAKGQITAVAGGHQADGALALTMLVNAINGAYDQEQYPIDVVNSMMALEGGDEYDEYCKWCIGYEEDFYNRQNLNMDEIRNLCVKYNPSATIDDLKAVAANISLEDVKKRHEGLVK